MEVVFMQLANFFGFTIVTMIFLGIMNLWNESTDKEPKSIVLRMIGTYIGYYLIVYRSFSGLHYNMFEAVGKCGL